MLGGSACAPRISNRAAPDSGAARTMRHSRLKVTRRSRHRRARGTGAFLAALAAFAALLLPASAPAQPTWITHAVPAYRPVANTLGEDAGTPYTAQPLALAQDESGFIWIGTDSGLERWDGYKLRSYDPQSGDPCAPPAAAILLLRMDHQHRLWIATLGHGLWVYESPTECFRPVGSSSGRLAHGTVEAVAEDGTGGVWVGTDDGLLRVGADLQTVTASSADGSGGGRLGAERVTALLRDGGGNLWAGTDNGVLRLAAGASHFAAVPLPRGTKVRDLFEASDGRIWVASFGGGAFAVDPVRLTARSVQGLVQQGKVPEVLRLAESPDGDIWLGTVAPGIIPVDPKTLQARAAIVPHISPVNSNDDTFINSMLRDRSGLMWTATESGVGYFLPRKSIATWPVAAQWKGIPNGGIEAAARVGNDRVALSVAGHVALFGSGDAAVSMDLSALPVPVAYVTGLASMGSAGLFAIAKPGGLAWAGLADRRFHAVPLPRPGAAKGAKSVDILSLQIEDENLWVGGFDGLWMLGPDHQASGDVPWRILKSFDLKEVLSIATGPHGERWIGTPRGLYRLGDLSGAPVHVALSGTGNGDESEPEITSIAFDDRQRMWLGTNGLGVFVVEPGPGGSDKVRVIRHFGNGLPKGIVGALVNDGRGGMWVTNGRAMGRFDSASLALRVFNPGDGAANSGFGTGLLMYGGELLFAGDRGMTVVEPDWHDPSVSDAPLAITRIMVANREIPVAAANYVGDEGGLRIELPADRPDVTVEYATLDYADPTRNRYEHRLDGYDRDWVVPHFDPRTVSYMNLAPGLYRLHLRGSDHAGIWCSQERQLRIYVPTPWFQTMWFHLVELAAAVLVLIFTVQARTALLRRRQRELESLVEKRTLALVEANDERNGLIEGLAHDIRTPLTAMRGYLETLRFRSTALAEPERHRYLEIALRQADRLGRLVRELFDLVRLDDARIPMTIESIMLAELVQDIFQEFQALAEGRSIRFQCDEAAKVATLRGDINLLQRLVDNLVYNAIVHTPPQGTIRADLAVDAGSFVLVISDTGRGIAASDQERMFKRYERGRDADPAAGAGLGLAIAKKIVELHGGSIRVDSELGAGTRFTVTLPATGPTAAGLPA